MKVKWAIEADYLQGCNCDYGCPCEFSAPPTLGYCQGAGAWNINVGHYQDVELDGLGLGFVAHWPQAIHQGNGTVCILVDEKASAQQRDALLQIASGQAGGMPFELIVTTFSKVLDPLFLPFKFSIKGKDSSVRVGGALTINLAAIKNPVTGEPEAVSVNHSTGFIFKEAECLSAEETMVMARELSFSWPKKAGFLSKVKYSN